MQLKDRDGIACDHCGTQYKNDFLYYSWDFRPVSVNSGQRPQLNHIFRTQISFSLDVCTSCFAKFKEQIVANYKSGMDQQGAFTICELTGTKLVGTYNYYHIEVTKVNVRMTGQPNICTNCQAKTFDVTKICPKCNHTEFIKPAAIDTDKRFVELNLSEEAFEMLRQKAEQTRKVAGQWQTSS
jgi:hypothetical protein